VQAHNLAKTPLVWIQGGAKGDDAADASAATHSGLGVMDTRRWNMSMADAKRTVAYGLECGVVGFIRGVPGYDRMETHIHWVKVDAKSIQHSSTYDQVYDRDFGYKYGGGGLGGAQRVRWYGPPRKPLVSWDDSKYNPKNGWRP